MLAENVWKLVDKEGNWFKTETRLGPKVPVFFLPQSDLLGSKPDGLK